MICNSRCFNIRSCKTFLIATVSLVSLIVARNTEPKVPCPINFCTENDNAATAVVAVVVAVVAEVVVVVVDIG